MGRRQEGTGAQQRAMEETAPQGERWPIFTGFCTRPLNPCHQETAASTAARPSAGQQTGCWESTRTEKGLYTVFLKLLNRINNFNSVD